MNPRCSRQGNRALTLLEVLVVVVILFVVAVLVLPNFSKAQIHDGPRCINNVMQIGLACRVWAGDHNDEYPMEVSAADGGTKDLMSRGTPASQLVLLNFLAMSNELSTPKLLHCPADTHAAWAIDFSTLNRSNISYFINPDADEMHPQMMLSGDDNFAIGGVPVNSGILNLSTNTSIAWTDERHRKCGNIGLADGSAQQLTTAGLQQAFQRSGTTLRFAIP